MERSIHGRTTLVALVCALVGLAALPALAQANVTLPGLNGKIAFASDRDAPAPPPEDLRGGGQDCEGAPFNDPDCGFDIFTVDPGGTALANLTRDQDGENNAKDDKPSWSPDGTLIAFESRRDCADDDANRCQSDIYVMDADGGNPRQLTDGPDSDTHPTWSPDGRTIAFERNDNSESGADRIYTLPANATPAVEPTLVPTSGEKSSDSDLLPAWSPDGNRIAFTRISGEPFQGPRRLPDVGELSTRTEGIPAGDFSIHTYVINLTTNDVTPVGPPQDCSLLQLLLSTCQLDFNPAWSPDGTRLAYHRLEIGSNSSFELPEVPKLRGAEEPPIDDADVVSSQPNPEADGFANLTKEEGCSSFGGQAALRGVTVECADEFKPAYSPDNSRLAFHSDRNSGRGCDSDAQGPSDDSDCRPQLYTMNANGSDPTPLAAALRVTDRNADWQRIVPPPPPTITTPSTPAATRDTRRPRVSVAAVRGCSASRRLRVPVRIAERGGIRSVTVTLDGRRIARTRKTRFTLTINARRLRPGRHRLRIVAVDASGNRTTVNRTIARCAQRVAPRAPSFTG